MNYKLRVWLIAFSVLLQNEGMTGVLLFNIRFSRMTLGLLEDTGLVCAPCKECLNLTFIAVPDSSVLNVTDHSYVYT